jgi:polyphosphate kinase
MKNPPDDQKRHTHATAAAFEDVIAIQMDIIWKLIEAMEQALHRIARSDGLEVKKEVISILVETIEFSLHRLANSTEVLKQARQGPHAYDPDRPAGQRFVMKRR